MTTSMDAFLECGYGYVAGMGGSTLYISSSVN